MKVIQTIQSPLVDSLGQRVYEPVDVVWYNGTSLVQVMGATAQALADTEAKDEFGYYEVLAVRVEL